MYLDIFQTRTNPFFFRRNQIKDSSFISSFNHAKFFKEILKSFLSSKRDQQLLHNILYKLTLLIVKKRLNTKETVK